MDFVNKSRTGLELRMRRALDDKQRPWEWLKMNLDGLALFMQSIPTVVTVQVRVERETDAALFLLHARRRIAVWTTETPLCLRVTGSWHDMKVEHLWAEKRMTREGIPGDLIVTVDLFETDGLWIG